jgi:putative ABC transport system permease protein
MTFFDRDKWQEIFSTIQKNKLRTFLTALGVFWGIFMLIFLLGMGAGLKNGVFKDFGGRAKNVMYVSAWRTSVPYKGFQPGRRIRLKLEDIEMLKTNIPEIGKIAPRKEIGTGMISYGSQKEEYTIRGELTDMIHIEALVLKKGRYINQKDINEARKVAVIGEEVKDVLFGKEQNCIGQHILVKGIDFKVVGVFGPEDLKERTRSDMESIVIPLTTMYRTFGINRTVDWFVCSAAPNIAVSDMEVKVRSALKESHKVSPDDKDAIQGFNLEEEFNKVKNLFIGIEFFLWFVGIGTLLAGIIGVSNIMMIIVKERKKEIGVRKAMGATPGSIISLILTESIFITTISGYLGLIFGTLVIAIINYIMVSNNLEPDNFYNPEVNLYAGILSLITLVIAGAIAGLIPAFQAANINPVEALKDE